MSTATETHARLMDGVYRYQRHIYDATRKYFLLGRDELIEALDPPPGGTVLEVGCGTGRNLIAVARRWPQARLYGFDISSEMLATARGNIARAGLSDRIRLAQGDATAFEPDALFGERPFDRVFCSYTLSMIPDWHAAIRAGLRATAPDGALLAVDFGGMEGLPGWFRTAMARWLALFHVTIRDSLVADAEALARSAEAGPVTVTPLFRGYARLLQVAASPSG